MPFLRGEAAFLKAWYACHECAIHFEVRAAHVSIFQRAHSARAHTHTSSTHLIQGRGMQFAQQLRSGLMRHTALIVISAGFKRTAYPSTAAATTIAAATTATTTAAIMATIIPTTATAPGPSVPPVTAAHVAAASAYITLQTEACLRSPRPTVTIV
eukprot:1142938-Pelagomonas_calceolata.AAC.6